MDAKGARWTAGEARAVFSRAPKASLHDLAPEGAIVVVAPHPDDETLGCGGLIAEAAAAGRRVVVALMTDGAASHPGSPRFDAQERGALRDSELRAALKALATDEVEIMAFGASDGGLAERQDEAALWLKSVLDTSGACALFVTWDADHHPDHKAAFACASRAAKKTGAALWAYPVWSLILPDDAEVGPPYRAVALDTRHHRVRKRAAIACHASQLDAEVMADPDGFLLRTEDVERHTGGREIFLAIRQRA